MEEGGCQESVKTCIGASSAQTFLNWGTPGDFDAGRVAAVLTLPSVWSDGSLVPDSVVGSLLLGPECTRVYLVQADGRTWGQGWC